ncbi:MAG: tetratricopeptide repeat protein [Magnetococcales bacterium]|nr:tetratricopeptide repeat protein [Magnetococcales bacterium]
MSQAGRNPVQMAEPDQDIVAGPGEIFLSLDPVEVWVRRHLENVVARLVREAPAQVLCPLGTDLRLLAEADLPSHEGSGLLSPRMNRWLHEPPELSSPPLGLARRRQARAAWRLPFPASVLATTPLQEVRSATLHPVTEVAVLLQESPSVGFLPAQELEARVSAPTPGPSLVPTLTAAPMPPLAAAKRPLAGMTARLEQGPESIVFISRLIEEATVRGQKSERAMADAAPAVASVVQLVTSYRKRSAAMPPVPEAVVSPPQPPEPMIAAVLAEAEPDVLTTEMFDMPVVAVAAEPEPVAVVSEQTFFAPDPVDASVIVDLEAWEPAKVAADPGTAARRDGVKQEWPDWDWESLLEQELPETRAEKTPLLRMDTPLSTHLERWSGVCFACTFALGALSRGALDWYRRHFEEGLYLEWVVWRAEKCLQKRDVAGAVAILEPVTQGRYVNAEVFLLLAQTLDAVGDNDQALRVLLRGLTRDLDRYRLGQAVGRIFLGSCAKKWRS